MAGASRPKRRPFKTDCWCYEKKKFRSQSARPISIAFFVARYADSSRAEHGRDTQHCDFKRGACSFARAACTCSKVGAEKFAQAHNSARYAGTIRIISIERTLHAYGRPNHAKRNTKVRQRDKQLRSRRGEVMS